MSCNAYDNDLDTADDDKTVLFLFGGRAERYDNVVDQGGGKAGKPRPNNSMTR